MEKQNELWFFFQFLQEVEKELSKEEEKQVMIEKAINLKLMCDYVVSCSYGDIVLIICMLRDYVKMFDEVRSDIQWEVYYRDKFIKMADRLSKQIEYDYDAALEKCRKKLGKKECSSDVGGEAIALAVKHSKGKKRMKRRAWMERIDCEKCVNGHFYDGDKLRCRLKRCQPDYADMQEARQALCEAFPGSYINAKHEFIAEARSNQYFMLNDCEYPEDIECKVLEWLSRAASKGAPFNQEWRNRRFRKFMLDGMNNFLDTSFSEKEMGEIYTYLGNACNHRKTQQFIESGFDMKVLKEEGHE